MNKKIMVSILITILVLLSGCVSAPKPVVLSKNAEGTLQGLNTVTIVTADIENQGPSGDVLVKVEVKAPDKQPLNQQQVIYIEKGMIKKVSFTFDTEFGDNIYYSVTAEPN
ncbi:MAG TPA: hypothetical protein VF354_03515 [Candidatus Methanoperedens sp.]